MTATWLPRAFALLLGLSAAACGGYDPCGDKNCGDTCQLCEEGDADCTERPGQKVCNAAKVCASALTPICT